jgi:hypothetical protein
LRNPAVAARRGGTMGLPRDPNAGIAGRRAGSTTGMAAAAQWPRRERGGGGAAQWAPATDGAGRRHGGCTLPRCVT